MHTSNILFIYNNPLQRPATHLATFWETTQRLKDEKMIQKLFKWQIQSFIPLTALK